MTDIDRMDIFGYWRIRVWEERSDKTKKKPTDEAVYIDDLF